MSRAGYYSAFTANAGKRLQLCLKRYLQVGASSSLPPEIDNVSVTGIFVASRPICGSSIPPHDYIRAVRY